MQEIFICPICKKQLSLKNNSLVCPQNHSYDLAKSGYVNLVIHKNSSNPGDNKELICSRRDFLNRDFYKPLSDLINLTASKLLNKNSIIIDSGCGTGYYLDNLYKDRIKHGYEDTTVGIDISKEGILIASKKTSKSNNYAVASVYSMPFADNFANLIISVFAPYAIQEFNRVLLPDGYCIVVYPAKEHLIELKNILYADKAYENDKSFDFSSLEVISSQEIKFTMNLSSSQDISNLFNMTPYAYKTPAQAKAKLLELNALDITAHFTVAVLKKEGK